MSIAHLLEWFVIQKVYYYLFFYKKIMNFSVRVKGGCDGLLMEENGFES